MLHCNKAHGPTALPLRDTETSMDYNPTCRGAHRRAVLQPQREAATPHNFRVPRPQQALPRRCRELQSKWPHYALPLASAALRPHPHPMSSPATLPLPPSPVPREIPDSFFLGMADPEQPQRNPANVGKPQSGSAPMRALILYDAIIDDIFTNPTTTLVACAARLGKAASTVSLVVRSDFFRARWLQRREQYNADLNFRLSSKIAAAAEKSLDATMTALKDRTNIPLPVLDNINKTLLDRLGYAPSASGGPAVVVNNNNTAAVAGAVANAEASPDGLANARRYLAILERRNAASGASPGNTTRSESRDLGREAVGPVVEGEARRVNP